MSREVLNSAEGFIAALSRNYFYNNFVRVVGRTRAFGALASFKAVNLSEGEKTELRKLFSENMGVPDALMDTNEKLDILAAVATARAATLR